MHLVIVLLFFSCCFLIFVIPVARGGHLSLVSSTRFSPSPSVPLPSILSPFFGVLFGNQLLPPPPIFHLFPPSVFLSPYFSSLVSFDSIVLSSYLFVPSWFSLFYHPTSFSFFVCHVQAPTAIYTLFLHDDLPIYIVAISGILGYLVCRLLLGLP